MYNLLKKTICILMAVALFATIPLGVTADEAGNMEDASDEYVSFTTDNRRIASDGTFEFNVRAERRSENDFIVGGNSITISAKCRKYNVNTGHPVEDDTKQFTVTLYKSSSNEEIGSFDGFADDETYKKTFTVEKGQQYYIIVTCSPTLTMPYSLKGTGKVSKIDKVVSRG